MLRIILVVLSLSLAGCGPSAPPPVKAPPTPTPVSEKEIERAIRDRSAEQNRAIEQGLANQRAAADAVRIDLDIQRRLVERIERQRAVNPSPSPLGQ